MRISRLLAVVAGCFVAPFVLAQENTANNTAQRLRQGGCVVLDAAGAKACRYDYTVDDRRVEALLFRPSSISPAPGILMIPGYQRTAWNLIPIGTRLAEEGFASVAVTQPGFGESQGPPDFAGPKTLKVLAAGYRKLQSEAFVNPRRMGLYGYSRGAMAASLLALSLEDVRAAVFGAGVYDFQKAYDESTLPGVRQNMQAETGMTPGAIRDRSSILRMESLKCPVLILHGEKDKNVPVGQALRLRDRLTALHKDFEIKLFPDREHSIGPEVTTMTVDFFQRRLK